MAQKIIESIGSDGLEVLSNILDKDTGEYITYKEVDFFIDGTPMEDSKVYKPIYIKRNNKYFKRVYTGGINVKWFGAKGDGTADDTIAIQNAINTTINISRITTSSTNNELLFPIDNIFNISNTIEIPQGINVNMGGRISYIGIKDKPAVIIGTIGQANRGANISINISTPRSNSGDWDNSDFIGCLLLNSNQCNINITNVSGFYKGVVCLGDGQGFAYNKTDIQILNSNKIGIYLDYINSGWCNENNFYGGRLGTTTGYNLGQGRYGVRITGDDNRFYSPSFELSYPASAPELSQAAIFDDAYQCMIFHCRNEGNSSKAIAGSNGPSFVLNGDSKHNKIIVDYTYTRSSGTIYNVFEDNSLTKQNEYVSTENKFVDLQKGEVIFNSGNLPSKYSSSNGMSCRVKGTLFVNHLTGAISETSPDDLNTTIIRTSINDIPSLNIQRSGIGVWVDTTVLKKLGVTRIGNSRGRGGQVGIKFYDEFGIEINSQEVQCIDDQIEGGHANQRFTYDSSYGGCYITGTPAPLDVPIYFSIKEVVKKVFLFIGAPAGQHQLSSFSIYSLDDVKRAASIFSGIKSDGLKRIDVFPPTKGNYAQGEVYYLNKTTAFTPHKYVCDQPGTEKVINTNGSYTAGTVISDIADISQFAIGDFIDVATSTGTRYIVEGVDTAGNSIVLNSSFGLVAGVGLAITNFRPIWKEGAVLDALKVGGSVPEGIEEGLSGVLYQRLSMGNVNEPLFVKVIGGGNTGWKAVLTKNTLRDVVAIPSADPTDLPSALVQIKDLKTKVNEILALLK